MKTLKLLDKEIVEICNKVIKEVQIKSFPFLCILFAEIINERFKVIVEGKEKEIQKYIPEFTRKNAEQFGALQDEEILGWWEYTNIADRIAFVEWIITQHIRRIYKKMKKN